VTLLAAVETRVVAAADAARISFGARSATTSCRVSSPSGSRTSPAPWSVILPQFTCLRTRGRTPSRDTFFGATGAKELLKLHRAKRAASPMLHVLIAIRKRDERKLEMEKSAATLTAVFFFYAYASGTGRHGHSVRTVRRVARQRKFLYSSLARLKAEAGSTVATWTRISNDTLDFTYVGTLV